MQCWSLPAVKLKKLNFFNSSHTLIKDNRETDHMNEP